MNIIIQIPQLIFGGAEKVLVNFANCLVEKGHQVTVLETYEKGYLKPQFDQRVRFDAICSKEYTERYYCSLQDIRAAGTLGKKVIGCGKLAFSKVVGYRRFAEKLATKRYAGKQFDVAINYLEIDSPRFLLEHIQAKKYVQWYHTDVANLEHPEETDAMIPWYERMDAVICVARTAKEHFVQRYPALQSKTHVIYNFFEEEKMLVLGKEHISLVGEKPCLLSVGRMTAAKQYPRFLKVLARLREAGFSFGWHLLGTGYQLEEIKQLIEDYDLSDWVYLEGLTDNPYKYMAACDLFVLPSGWEGFPTVTVEAKMLGCPVLATDVSGIREQLVHGETGWIVENSEEGIYEGLRHLLEHPKLWQRLKSKAGMEAIFENERKYQAFLELCDSVI